VWELGLVLLLLVFVLTVLAVLTRHEVEEG
jgi:hypothetical protein